MQAGAVDDRDVVIGDAGSVRAPPKTARSSSWFGTGRVMSLTTMAMLCPGRTRSRNGGPAIGFRSASRIASAGSSIDAVGLGRSTVA